jgi:hypothetical protein
LQNKNKEKYLETLETEYEQNGKRIALMREHLKNVQSLFQNAQYRNLNKQKEIDSEKQIQLLSESEQARIKSDSGKLRIETEKAAERVRDYTPDSLLLSRQISSKMNYSG